MIIVGLLLVLAVLAAGLVVAVMVGGVAAAVDRHTATLREAYRLDEDVTP